MTRDRRLVRMLVACYPLRWRQRYGEEYAQLLCDLRIHRRPALILDSLRGAVRVRGGDLMTVRAPMAVAVWAAGLFAIAGISFQKLAEDFDRIGSGVYTLLVVAAAVALAALVVAAAPAGIAALRDRNAGAWRFVAIPIVGVVAWYGTVRYALQISGGHAVHSGVNIVAFGLVATMGVAVVAATAWAANSVLARSKADYSTPTRRVALTLVAAGMGTATVAALIWGLQVGSRDPSGFHGNHGLVATPFMSSWIGAVVVMAIATALAGGAARKQLSAA